MTDTNDTSAVGATGGASLFDKTLTVLVKKGKFGQTRKAKGAAQSVAAAAVQSTPEMTALSKRLFKAAEYQAIVTIDNDLKKFLSNVSLPSMLAPGSFAIPIPLVEQVDDKIVDYTGTRAAAVTVLQAAWPRIVDESAAALGGMLFDPRNYPSADQLPKFFYVEHRWLDYGVPGRLKAIKADIFTREREKAEAEIGNAKIEAINQIRARMLGVVANIVERLTGVDEKTGKKKTFRDSLLGNVKDFVDVFPVLNTAAGDDALPVLVQQARAALDGVDPKLLRSDDLVRQKVAQEFEKIQHALDGMLVEKTRRIRFDDEPAPAADDVIDVDPEPVDAKSAAAGGA